MKPSDLNKKHEALLKFADWTMQRIGLQSRPKIELTDDIAIVKKHRAYGATTPDNKIWVYVGKRTPADAMRTLCHELLHSKQFEDGVAHDHMDDKQEKHIEDLANAGAGRIMRAYGKKDSSIYESVNRDDTIVDSEVKALIESAMAELGIKANKQLIGIR